MRENSRGRVSVEGCSRNCAIVVMVMMMVCEVLVVVDLEMMEWVAFLSWRGWYR